MSAQLSLSSPTRNLSSPTRNLSRREDGVVITMTDSSEMRDTRCIAIESDTVSEVSLTSEPCFGPSTKLGCLFLNKEHTEENPHLIGSKTTDTKISSQARATVAKKPFPSRLKIIQKNPR
ncbi:hypothetical protein C0Q70_12802 [Pomacea canaliculata]|uniref:Uncharacterized protein n=1 Tax=Pomacea canaliculata TaxID=400727 RepID=A0A2T7P2H7_POMCA|nr:hypothetical protein C0Q70_12802 [Pomacea canaliculata]